MLVMAWAGGVMLILGAMMRPFWGRGALRMGGALMVMGCCKSGDGDEDGA